MKKIIYFLLLLVLMLPKITWAQSTMIHPGLSHKKSDLERMKGMVAAGIEPWKSSFQLMAASQYASYNYTVRGNAATTTLFTVSSMSGYNYDNFKFDGLAAYLNALMWNITGDVRHAQKAVEIFNAWSNITAIKTGGTRSLDAGRVIWKMLEGAEIIKSTYNGWASADIDRFKAMLVYPGYSSTVAPTAAIQSEQVSFYWMMYNGDPSRHGNQGLFGMRGIAAIGIFLDNRVIYERAIRYLKGMPHRLDDLNYPSGPPINGTTPTSASNEYANVFTQTGFESTVEDYGYNEVIANYIFENGQCQESSRDQNHSLLGVGIIMTIAEMAWNQGDDIYSFLDNRPLLGMEYSNRYNVSLNYSYPDQPTPWEPTVASGEFLSVRDRTGRWQSLKINPLNESVTTASRGLFFKFDRAPITEMALGHYRDRVGLTSDKYKWTQRAFDISTQEIGYEGQGFDVDYPGWGGLTFRRANLCHGDPCSFVAGKPVFAMNQIPGTIEAENFDYFPIDGQNKTYFENSSTNVGGQYRTNEAVDIETCTEGGFNLTSLEDGEWINYTVNVPTSGRYKLDIRYASSAAGGKIKFEFKGIDKTGEFDIPFGGANSTGSQDWKTLTIAPNFTLHAGVMSMRIKISGASNVAQLNSMTISYLGALPTQTITFPSISTKTIGTPDFDPGATSSAGLPITYTSSNSTVATIENGLVKIVGGGSCTITASQPGSEDFAPATSVSRTLLVTGIAAGDYLSSGNMNWNGGTWNISDGNGGISGTTTSAPTSAVNVHILTGHTVTLATTAGNCKGLTVQPGATLTETIALNVAGNLVMDGTMTHTAAVTATGDVFVAGTWTVTNNLTISKTFTLQPTGVYASTNVAGGSVNSLTINGTDATIRIDGRLGSTTTGTGTAVGEGIRLYVGGSGTVTITGSGIINIARFQPTAGNNTQNIIVDIDMNLGNTSVQTSGINTFSLNAGTGTKTLTLNAGKTIKITNPNGSFHSPSNATENNATASIRLGGAQNFGNMIYNINGTLDVSIANFVFYSHTSTSSPAATQTLTLNVGATGVLKLGANVRMAKNSANQNIYVNVADGGLIDATTAPLNLTTAPISANGHTTNGSGLSWFTLAPTATYKQSIASGVSTPLWIGVSNTKYSPLRITPTNSSVFEINLQEGFNPSGLPTTTTSKAVNRTWNITPLSPSSSALEFGYNASDVNPSGNATSDMKLIHYNTTTSSWENLGNSTPSVGSGTDYKVSYTGVSSFSPFVIGNVLTIPVSITNLNTFYCKTDSDVLLQSSPSGGAFTVDGQPETHFRPNTLSIGTHTVVYTHTDGVSTDTKSIQVGVVTPTISGAATVCSPNTVTLTAAGCAGSVTWSDASTGSILTIANTGTYSVTATCTVNGCTSDQSSPATGEIKAKPNAPTISGAATVCSPNTVTLTVAGCAGTITWSDASTGSILTIANTGTYSVTATCTVNGCTSDQSSPATGEIKAKPNAPTITGAATVCSPNTVTLTASGCAGSINWSDNSTASTLTISSVGTYSVTATCTVNGCTSDQSSPATGEIKAKPNAPTITGAATICSPNTVTLTASGCEGTITWSDNSTASTLTISSVGTYSVTATCTVNGCTSEPSSPATGEIKAKPNAPTITGAATVCSPNTVTLIASGCTGSINWSDNSTASTLTISSVGTYSVTATCTVNGCTSDQSSPATSEIKAKPNAPTITGAATVCSPNAVTLTASGCAGSITWSDNSTASTLTISSVGTYSVTATCTVNGCTSDASSPATGEIKAKPNAPTITGAATVCSPNTVALTASGCEGAVTWSDNSSASTLTISSVGTYSVTATCTVNGCTSDPNSPATGEIKAKPDAPIIAASPQSIVIGQSSNITASGCVGTVNWSVGGTINPLTVSPNQTTAYTATCSINGCESSISNQATVTVSSNEPCISQVNLSSVSNDYSSGTHLKQAKASDGNITATNKISGTARVTFESKVIELKPGFKANNGTVFSARIGGCN